MRTSIGLGLIGSSASREPTNALINTYFGTIVGVNQDEQLRVQRWWTRVVNAGLAGNTVDAALYRSTQNNIVTPKTIKLNDITTNGAPTWGVDGLNFVPGLNQIASFNCADSRPFSLAFDVVSSATGQPAAFATIAGMQNQLGGLTASNQLEMIDDAGFGAAAVVSNSGAKISNRATDIISSTCVSGNNPLRQTIVTTYDHAATPTVQIYVDGILAMTDNNAARTFQETNALNMVLMGSRFDAGFALFWSGVGSNIMLFNKVLSGSEINNITKAIRQLHYPPTNLVIDGDSFQAQRSDATFAFIGWHFRLMLKPFWAAYARLYSAAVGGIGVGNVIANFPTRVAPFVADGYTVTNSIYACGIGANDISAGMSSATLISNLNTIWVTAKAAPFKKVIAMTIGDNSTWTGPQQTVRAAVNTYIATAVSLGLVDAIFDLNTILGADTGAGNWGAGTHHPSAAGFQALADAFAGQFP